MQFTNILAIAVLFGSAFAAPAADANKPVKPSKPTPTTVAQSNSCGNGAAPFCCTTDGFGGFAACGVLAVGDTCTTTTVCCNANNSIQACLGNARLI